MSKYKKANTLVHRTELKEIERERENPIWQKNDVLKYRILFNSANQI